MDRRGAGTNILGMIFRGSQVAIHVIICGGGNMGQQIMRELAGADKACVVIERHADAIESLREINPDAAIVEEDATRDRVLREAGIGRATALVTCLSADTDNLFVCLSARDLNARLVIVARAEGKSTTAKMYRAGADHVVSPNRTGAVWVASVLVRPSVASFMDLSEKGRHLSRHIDQATVGVGSRHPMGTAGFNLGRESLADFGVLTPPTIQSLAPASGSTAVRRGVPTGSEA